MKNTCSNSIFKRFSIIRNFLICFVIAVGTNFNIGYSQMVGPSCYTQGSFIEFAIFGEGGFEGVNTILSPPPSGYHFRSGIPVFGFVANPQMDGWSTFDGDFYSPGEPENGWGIEIIDGSVDLNASNNRYDFPYGIPGAITGYTVDGMCRITTWEGNYISGSYNLHIRLDYLLYTSDLFYTTVVTITNNGIKIPDFYYYRNVDPDNNVSINGGDYSTQNTIVSQPGSGCNRAHVSATSINPGSQPMSYLGFAGVGPNFRVSYGGFSNRDASDIWNASGLTGTSGSSHFADEAISLAYRITNFLPGTTQSFRFVNILDDLAANNAINNNLFSITWPGAPFIIPTCTPIVPTVTICNGSSVPLSVSGPVLSDFNWTWSPSTGLSSTTGTTVSASPTSDITYTVNGTPTNPCYNPVVQQVHVHVIPNIFDELLINGPQYLCTGQSGLYGSNITGSTYQYTWSATGGTVASPNASSTLITFNSPGVQTVTLTVFDAVTGCTKTVYYSVNVYVQPVTPTISGSLYACQGITSYQITNYVPTNVYSFVITNGTLISGPNSSGIFTVSWTGVAGTLSIISSAPPPYDCAEKVIFNIAECCSDPMEWINVYPGHYDNTFDIWVDFLYPGPAVVSNKLITVNGTLDIDLSMTFNNCTFKMGDNAKINIGLGETLTLNGCTLTVCNQPWDGIYIGSSTTNLVMNNSLAEHAQNAVVSNNGGKFTINNSFFKDNRIGIDVRNYPTVAHPGTVYGTEFYTISPIISTGPFIGIQLRNLYKIVIGDQLQVLPSNSFHDLNFGISGGASNYEAYDNDFTDIPGSCGFTNNPNAGIFTLGTGSHSVNPNIKINRNRFTDTENGIVHAYIYKAVLHFNDFTNVSNYGYYCYDPQNLSATGYVKFEVNDLNQVKYGASIIETSIPNSITATVSGNSITNTDRGVYFNLMYAPNAEHNCIILNDPPSVSVWNVGILSQGCNSLRAISNSIKGSNLGTTTTGIRSDLSPANEIKDNIIDGCFLSLSTIGDCPTTKIKCNNLYNYFGAGYYQLNGQIGPQGSPSQSYYNKWYTNTNNKLVDAFSNGNLSRFYVRIFGAYNVASGQSQTITPGSFPIAVTQGLFPFPGGSNGCINNAPSFPCAPHMISSLDSTTVDTGKMARIMALYNWNTNPSIPKTAYEDYIQKDALYKMYLETPTDFSGINVPNFLMSLNPFQMKGINKTSIKLHKLPHIKFPSMDTTGVLLSDTLIIIPTDSIPEDTIVTYSNQLAGLHGQINKLIRTTYLRHKPYLFTQDEVDQLVAIAELCPIEYGKAVYQARAILEPITHQFYTNDCELPTGFGFYDTKSLEIDPIDSILVYPNPIEDGRLNIDLNTKMYQEATITIYNVMGRLVQTTALKESENVINIDALVPGNYLVIIKDEVGNNLYVGKIVKL